MPRQQKALSLVLNNYNSFFVPIRHILIPYDESIDLEDRSDKDRGDNYRKLPF
jgi:hypothetical protein